MAIKHSGATIIDITAVNHGGTSLTAVKHDTTNVFPDTPSSYSITFTYVTRVTSWNDTTSANISIGDTLTLTTSGRTATVTCSEKALTKWTRTASMRLGKVPPTIYMGTSTSDRPLLVGTPVTYDGSFTNLYAA